MSTEIQDDVTMGSTMQDDVETSSKANDTMQVDSRDPKNWSRLKKYSNFAVVFMNAFISYFSSAVYIPALANIQEYFGTNITTMNATIALFIMVSGVAPLFWGPLSERIGRRWVYTVSSVLYTVFTIVCGVSQSLGLFFAMRLLQGICASAGQAVGGGSVADLFHPQERGRAMSIFMFGTILGPAFGPLVGGYVNQYLDWRWIFYIKTIMGGVISIFNILILRETLYRPDNSTTSEKPQLWTRLRFNPFSSLALILRPEILLICLPMSVAFGFFYLLVTILPSTFARIYEFQTGTIGLCYLANGVGCALGSMSAGLISDKLYTWKIKGSEGAPKKELRLISVYIGAPFLVAGPIMYGWFLDRHLHFMAPLVAFAIASFGLMFTIAVCNTYLVDSFLPLSASVVSVTNFTRNIMGMMFSLLAVQVQGSLGDGWTYTLWGLLNLVFYFTCIPVVQHFGGRWRTAAPWWKKNETS